MARKPHETIQLKLRFSESLRRQLERAAAQNDRSMNAEIIDRLNYSFAAEHNAATQEEIISDLIRERDAAVDRAREIENLLQNIRTDVGQAVRDALAQAGLPGRTAP